MVSDDKSPSKSVSAPRIADRGQVQLVPLPVKIIFYLMFQCALYWSFFQLPWPLTESHFWGGRMMVKDIPQAVFTVFWLQFVAVPFVPGRLKPFFLIEFVAIVAFAFIPAWTSSFIRLGWLVLPNFLHAIYWIQFCAVGLALALSEIKRFVEAQNNLGHLTGSRWMSQESNNHETADLEEEQRDPLDDGWPHLLGGVSLLLFLVSTVALVVFVARSYYHYFTPSIGGFVFFYFALGAAMAASTIGTAVAAYYKQWARWPCLLLQIPACVAVILFFCFCVIP